MVAVVHSQTINNYYFSRSGNCLLDKIAQFPWPCTCKVSMIGRVLNLQDSRIVAIDWAFWLLICYLSALVSVECLTPVNHSLLLTKNRAFINTGWCWVQIIPKLYSNCREQQPFASKQHWAPTLNQQARVRTEDEIDAINEMSKRKA